MRSVTLQEALEHMSLEIQAYNDMIKAAYEQTQELMLSNEFTHFEKMKVWVELRNEIEYYRQELALLDKYKEDLIYGKSF